MSNAPSVLHVINSLDIGGTEKQLFLLLKYLDRTHFVSTVLSLSEGGHWADRIKALGIELLQLERQGSYEIKRLWKLMGIIRSRRPDIVHTWQPAGNLYGGIAARLSRHRRLILSSRSVDRPSGLRAAVDVGVYAGASAVVCNSRALADDLIMRRRVTAPPVVIHNGMEFESAPSGATRADRAKIRAQLDLPASLKVIGSVGRMVPFKNQGLVIQVAARILRERNDCCFLLIGDGPTRSELEARAHRLGVSGHIRFLGQRDDVPALLAACDVFLFPSRHLIGADGVAGEGFPNALMEAMRAGLPCIASNQSGAIELFSDGEAGYLLDSDDEAGFSRTLLQLLRDDQLRIALGNRGGEIVLKRFGADTMAQHFDELYSRMLEPIGLDQGLASA